MLVGEGPWAARAARPVAARELEREQRRDEQQKHEEHDERVAVQACSITSTVCTTVHSGSMLMSHDQVMSCSCSCSDASQSQ